MTTNSQTTEAVVRVERIEAKSCKRVRVGRYTTHTNGDSDYFQPVCACGWRGALYSNRTVEGRTLAQRGASEHRCQTPEGILS